MFRFDRGVAVEVDLQEDMSNEHESIHLNDPCHPGEVLRDGINGHGKAVQEAARLSGWIFRGGAMASARLSRFVLRLALAVCSIVVPSNEPSTETGQLHCLIALAF